MHADRTNRSLLTLLALLLIAAGAVGAAASFGALGSVTQHGALTHNRVGAYVGRHGNWLWPVIAVAALVITLLAVRWLLAVLLSTDRAGQLTVAGGGGPGRTTLLPAAVTEAVSAEIASYRGVQAARARLIGDPAAPTLVVTAELADTADLPRLRQRIESAAIVHARVALADPSLAAQLDLSVRR